MGLYDLNCKWNKKIDFSDISRANVNSDIFQHLTTLYSIVPANFPKILELGVRSGESTIALLAAVNACSRHLYSIDIEDCSNLFNPEFNNWTFNLGVSREIKSPEGEYDIIFVDTDPREIVHF